MSNTTNKEFLLGDYQVGIIALREVVPSVRELSERSE
jgi:hypothetical protein